MSSKAEQIIAAIMELDAAEREAVMAEVGLRTARPDQAEFDAACVALAEHRERLMEVDPSRKRTLEQVLQAVQSRVAK